MPKIKVKPDLTIKHIIVSQGILDDLTANANYEASGDSTLLVSSDSLEVAESEHAGLIFEAVKNYSGLILLTTT